MRLTLKSSVTALGASFRAVWWAFLRRDPLASSEETKKRLDICESCEFFDADSRQCLVCTCFIDAKTLLASERCPVGKWQRVRQRKRTVSKDN